MRTVVLMHEVSRAHERELVTLLQDAEAWRLLGSPVRHPSRPRRWRVADLSDIRRLVGAGKRSSRQAPRARAAV